MNKIKILVILFAFIVLIGMVGGIYFYTYWEPKENCHQGLCFVTIIESQYLAEHDGWFPSSDKGEIEALSKFISPDNPSDAYYFATYGTCEEQAAFYKENHVLSGELCPWRYIQGLREDDPQELIVMYRKERTRWRSHAQPNGFNQEFRWIVVPTTGTGHVGRQDSCWIDDKQLLSRLQQTMEYLYKNGRPNCELTQKEHSKFIEELRKTINGNI